MFTLPSASWQLARLASATAIPEDTDWMPASVPGAVQLDWGAAHGLPDIHFDDHVNLYQGLEDSYWLYRTAIPPLPENAAPGSRLLFVCDGLDYHADILLEGRQLGSETGFCVPFEYDLTDSPEGAQLEILFYPAPKRPSAPSGRGQADHVTKPAVSYGWDWHPRLIPLGLHANTRFEVRPADHLRWIDFDYVLADDFSSAAIRVNAETSTPGAAITWSLHAPDGSLAVRSNSPEATLASPILWWTHDQGEPTLYTLEVTLNASGHTLKRFVGFRRIRLVMHSGAWDSPSVFPKSRSHPPVTLELNGRVLFARGTNFVNPDLFPGRVTAETYRPLLELARNAHFNILRNWGGAPAPQEEFFEQCDALGLLVWQEFPLACNCYPDDPAYLTQLDRESRALIRRIRNHPSLAFWCGGNELFNAWSGMTDQSLALRLLNRNCYDFDPHTPFLPTAPLDGMGHGDYRFSDGERDIFQIFQTASNTAYSEFGCPGASSVDILRSIIPAADLWPPKVGTAWEVHHAFGSWDIDPTSWLCTTTLETYFGPASDLETLVAQSQWLQAAGYQSVYEEARRQAPRCSMALNWCFNEPWPSAANNNIVSWPAIPKPAYFAIREACRPTLASARIPRFQWRGGETFTAEIWLLHDGPANRPSGELIAELLCGDTKTELLRWRFPAGPALKNQPGPSVRATLPHLEDATDFTLRLSVPSQPEWSSTYRLHLLPPPATAEGLTRALNV